MRIKNLDHCRSFVAIVDAGSFNRAAEMLGVSQPSLTKRIQALEQDVGLQLLDRGPWGFKLTEAGGLFYRGAIRVLASTDDLEAGLDTGQNIELRLGAAATAAGSFLAPRLADWLPEHPEVHLTLIEDGARRMRRRLEDGECTIGVIASPVPPQFESRFITRVHVQALFPKTHPLATDVAPIPVSAFHGERVLLNGDGYLSTDLFLSACRIAHAEPETVYECSVGQTLAALVEGGLGVAVMGDSVDLRGFDLPRRRVLDTANQTLYFDLHLAWLRSRQLPPIVLDLVAQLCAKESAVGTS